MYLDKFHPPIWFHDMHMSINILLAGLMNHATRPRYNCRTLSQSLVPHATRR